MPKEKQTTKKQEKYTLILDAAETLMKKKGLYSLNMDEVSYFSNLAKGTLYLYFRSKEEILAALALKARILLLAHFEKAVLNENQPIQQLKAIIHANYTFLKNNPLYYELVSFYEINDRETETEEMSAVILRITELVIGIIKNGQLAGEIDSRIDPSILSFTMWGMTVGIMQLLKVKAATISNHPNLSENIVLDNYIKVFLDGIK
ncbi:TetR/AcrR family transcriptional regulator [Dyadobacter arcticus]|uniref:AcrR family transcriptional regulator n=1 Tax=Dyadobacter arcticus TaxID=1078754 RepID=A0ABX0UNC7_9BACT|nr:TetR/AcrR family transcriptional regulator [Dyadobacter arcticus]NIJ52955.1 AcrR family transcriptional regulator [Dyadobacter arcticus]